MHDLEPVFGTEGLDAGAVDHLGHELFEVREKLNEPIGVNTVRANLKHRERGVPVPPLVNSEVLVALLVNDLDGVADVQEVLRGVDEFLLNRHAARCGVFVQ